MEIQFFGTVKEKTGSKKISCEDKIKNTAELKSWLRSKYPDIEKYAYQIAINGAISEELKTIKSSDNISIITPVIGG
jgi:molybdopterin converting factor small subunit